MARTERSPMPTQDAAARVGNWDEVALGYAPEQAQAEAQRCLQCKNPLCVAGCPVGVRIPEFIAALKSGDVAGAGRIIGATNALPGVCGRVCPQEEQCEKACVLGRKQQPVAIGNLERYVADANAQDAAPDASTKPNGGKRVAIVGSGPAGLSCAGSLAALGYAVTVYEALHAPGGVLMYGIPEFRLPKALVKRETAALARAGVTFVLNAVIGRTLSLDALLADYDAVFLGSGAGLPSFLGIPGENLVGVLSANEYLTRINLMGAWKPGARTPVPRAKRAVVIGGGNVAMDAARCARRMGADVTLVYRRSMEELPARREEVHHAQEEGIGFALLSNPTEILGDKGRVTALRCQRMELGQPDASGRRSPHPIADSAFDLACDIVIVAIGTTPNPLLPQTTPDLQTNRRGCIVVTDEGRTAKAGVWAGGDAVTGAATVILAMGAGRSAAQDIHRALSGEACASNE